MNDMNEKSFVYTIERNYGSIENFESICDSYRAFYSKVDDHNLDLMRYSSDGPVPIVVENAVYRDGMVDINVFLDGVLRGFVVGKTYSDEIMRVYDQLPAKAEVTENGIIHLDFLKGKLFMASVDSSIITYLMPLDVEVFEKQLRIMVESEDIE